MTVEEPKIMTVQKVEFPDKKMGYDVNELEYCCEELKRDLIADGGAIILVDEGLCLRTNVAGPKRLLKYCYNCGTKIEQDVEAVDKPLPEIHTPVKDKVV